MSANGRLSFKVVRRPQNAPAALDGKAVLSKHASDASAVASKDENCAPSSAAKKRSSLALQASPSLVNALRRASTTGNTSETTVDVATTATTKKQRKESTPIGSRNRRSRASRPTASPSHPQQSTIVNFFPHLPKASCTFSTNATATGSSTSGTSSGTTSAELAETRPQEQAEEEIIVFSESKPEPPAAAFPLHDEEDKENAQPVAKVIPTTWHRTVSPTNTNTTPNNTANNTANSKPTDRAMQLLWERRMEQLPLPQHYQLVWETYEALEAICVLFMGRGQAQELNYHKIQKSVSNITKRFFNLELLGKILAIQSDVYHLSVVPTTVDGKRIQTLLLAWPLHQRCQDYRQLSTHVLRTSMQRKKSFRSAIVGNVISAYQEWRGRTLGEAAAVEEEMPEQWDPAFPLDQVPELVARSDLVEDLLKNAASKKECPIMDSKQQLLGTCSSSSSKTPAAIPKAGGSHPCNVSAESEKEQESTTDDAPFVYPTEEELKKMTVLERVRLKQKQRMLEKGKQRDKASIARRSCLSQLVAIVDVLDMYYHTQQKKALYIQDVLKKLVYCHKTPISQAEARSFVDELAQIAPHWLKLNVSEFGTLVEVDRTQDTRAIQTTIRQMLDAL